MIKNILSILIILGIIGASYFITYSPCDTPLKYSIGTIDPRFNITKEELIEDSKVAANIWNATQDRQLLTYDPTSEFTINMVYDSRQELTTRINDMDRDLKTQQGDIDPKIEEYKSDQLAFEKKSQALNEDIKYWNSRGGAPEGEYEKLIASQEELKKELASLNARAQALGQATSNYNVSARKLNQTIDNYQQVLEYKPEEGLYEQENGKRKISIYIDVDKDDFLHTLAHEFGHALGLDHTENKDSIMYYQTNSTLTPSSEEVAALKVVCEKRPLYQLASQKIRDVIFVLQERFQTVQANQSQNPGK